MSKIPFLRPNVVGLDAFEADLRSIEQTRLYSNYGPLNTRFEARMVAEWFGGVGHGTTVCNATLGLLLAIARCKRPGKYALMPSFTFAATPLAAQWCGLEPLFVDVTEDEWVLDEGAVKAALDQYGDEIAVMVPYATFGTHMDLSLYSQFVRDGIPVVVDAAPCLGTQLDGVHLGQGFEGSVVFSLHATKAFCIGEGGYVYSANKDFIGETRRAANYGFDANRASAFLGLNAKLPEISAAVGLATLDAYALKRERRSSLFDAYAESLSAAGLMDKGFRLQATKGDIIAHQFLPLLLPADVSREHTLKVLSENDVEARSYFSPACHEQPQFAASPHTGLAVTHMLSERIMSLPLWEEMTPSHVERVVSALRQAADRA